MLRIFQSEINAQIAVIKQQRADTFLATQQKSQVNGQVIYWRDDVANLQKVIDSGGEVPLNPATDPQTQSLTKQRAAEQAVVQQDYHQWQCQLYGGPGWANPVGNGPLAEASETAYNQAQAQVAALNGKIQQRLNQLSATDAAAKQSRLQQANTALGNAQQQLNMAVIRQNTLQRSFDAQNEATNGLLIRLEALDQLSSGNFTVNTARFLLFLLFLVIECLPVTVKLLQKPGIYEKILKTAAEQELGAAKRAYRRTPRPEPGPIPDSGRATRRDTTVHDIWQRTKVLSDVPETEPRAHDLGITESGAFPQLDDAALRTMADVHNAADGRRRGGGTPLVYDDDELWTRSWTAVSSCCRNWGRAAWAASGWRKTGYCGGRWP